MIYHIKKNTIVKTLQLFSALGLLGFMASCVSSPVKISETKAQRMVVDQSKRLTKLQVQFAELPEGVEFNHLVYNRQQVPVDIENNMVTAIVQTGGVVVENSKQIESNKQNSLVYTYKGKQRELYLDDIEYLPSKIVPNQH